MIIAIPDNDIEAWKRRLAEIKGELCEINEKDMALRREQATLYRKVMAIDFLTDSTKLRESVLHAHAFGLLGEIKVAP
jgi:undecaprenyl pyrophosphate synthase